MVILFKTSSEHNESAMASKLAVKADVADRQAWAKPGSRRSFDGLMTLAGRAKPLLPSDRGVSKPSVNHRGPERVDHEPQF
jgi:hypothetical protein